MEIKLKLLDYLANGRFHSGETLASYLGVSRAAVWKHMKVIEDEMGIKVDAVRGRGYRISYPLELLSVDRIKTHLAAKTIPFIRRLHIHHRIDSTNSWLMREAELAAESGTVCMAEQQTAGKGRHGRTWVSPFGRNIYLSLLWRFEMAPYELSGMSLAAGIAVLRTLRQYDCYEAGLKWPNDVLWQGKKLAGLLLEVAGETTGPAHVVIGLGLNVQMDVQSELIKQPWVDLTAIPDMKDISRNELVAKLLDNLVDVIEGYQEHGLAGFIDEWTEYDLLIGEEVVVRSASQVFQGQHLGIDASGGIRLNINGNVQTFFAGEVSLRGMPG